MPRIAASLAAVITLAVCIGFNTVRYPIVWEMVACAHRTPLSQQASVSQPSPSALSLPAESHPGYVCSDGVCRLIEPEAPQPATPSKQVETTPPAILTVDQHPRSTPTATPATPVALKQTQPASQALPAEPPAEAAALVPVARPPRQCKPVAHSTPRTTEVQAAKADPPASGLRVRHLPPVDPVATLQPPDQETLPLGQIPIYPSTSKR